MENIRETIAKNLIELRKKHNLTQEELAKKLNYSDNTISRWERAEITPSIESLEEIAAVYGISIELLLKQDAPKKSEQEKRVSIAKHIATIILCVCQVWFVAAIGFFYVYTFNSEAAWILFVWAVPLSCIIAFILSLRWHSKITNFVLLSVFLWSLIASIYLQFVEHNLFLLYIIGIPIQISLAIYYFMRKREPKTKNQDKVSS